MKKIVALLMALMLLVSVSFTALAEDAALTGEITAADKHGNVSTSLPAADLLERYALGDMLTVVIGEQRIAAPLVGSYSDVNVGEPLVYANGDGQVAFAINYNSFAETYSALPGVAFEIELLESGAYLEQYEVRNLVRSESRDDYSTDEIFANFRPVIDGVLYRGASPVLTEDARAPYVKALVEASGIKTVINLAQTDEELAAIDKPYGDMSYVAVGMSANVASDGFVPALQKALAFMLDNDAPYFIHCNEGKDRAGIVCAIIEGLIGFTPDEIVADYMQSYINYYGIEPDTEKYELLAQQIRTIMETLLGSPMNENTLQSNVEKYLSDVVGVDTAKLCEKLPR